MAHVLPAPPFVAAPFRCHPLLCNQHVQTVFSTFFPRKFAQATAWRAAAQERLFEMPDGDRLKAFLHLHPDDSRKKRPLLVLLHGLEGSVDADYVLGTSTKAFELGFSTLRLNYRNCGGTEHLAERLYNGHMYGDIDLVLRQMAAEGHDCILPVGVSLGANLLLNLLAEYGSQVPEWLIGAVAISPPIDMVSASRAFGIGLGRLYDRYFLLQLRDKLRRRAELRPEDPRRAEFARLASQARCLREFDDAITAPEGSYRDAMDYYMAASSAERIGHIHVPTLLIHAQDDPFIPFEMFAARAAAIAANPCLTTVFPDGGGHVGFLEADWAPQPEPWMDAHWAENQAIRYVRHLFEALREPSVAPAS